MNKSNLKSYAPQARKDFIAAVTARANLLGLSDKAGDKAGTLEVAPAQTQGDVTVIAGQAWPAKVSGQRDKLIERIRKDGFDHTMEAVAYTWFNRFAALRYMELHDYLGHGHRALSSTSGGLPEILTHATDLTSELPGLNATKVTELKLAGNRDGELYRMLLVAQCNALSRTMPFLFERIDDDSELLLPDNLLRSDSVIAKLVEEIPEEDWAEVEIIGWLYQFYISEKKDQVIGKVVKSEDIPAATQLFTPNWIVQYLVQNSVGRLWLMANPQSTLAQEWPYYITPAEQTPEVQAQLDDLIQTRVREDGDTLNPESITVLDPACGSGHILVVAYDVLKANYLERGYQPRAIPRLILEKNLFGLDIDDRAAQMAGFALLMKARADDRRLFTATDDAGNLQPPKLNVLSLQESKGLSVDELATHLAPFKVQRATIAALVDTFEHAKTFGSLIQIPYALKSHLVELPEVLTLVKQSGDMYASAAADDLLPLVQQAQMLAMQFDAVVANPPYMGGKAMNDLAKVFVADQFPESKSDLFSCFIERSYTLTKSVGYSAMVTMQSWMFLSSYQEMRERLLREKSIATMAHLGPGGFDHASAMVVQTTAFVFMNRQPIAKWVSPTVNFEIEHVKRIPFAALPIAELEYLERIFAIARDDWNAYERSWDFSTHPLVTSGGAIGQTIELNYKNWLTENARCINEIQNLEKRNNELFIDAYGLASELASAVPIQQITLTSNPDYRYSGNPSDEDKWERFRFDTAAELISYAIGCMMGRYSLDEPGLIYAHAGSVGFEPGRYATFPADADGIVPITDELWFADDAPSRIREFLRAVWGPDTLEENIAWGRRACLTFEGGMKWVMRKSSITGMPQTRSCSRLKTTSVKPQNYRYSADWNGVKNMWRGSFMHCGYANYL